MPGSALLCLAAVPFVIAAAWGIGCRSEETRVGSSTTASSTGAGGGGGGSLPDPLPLKIVNWNLLNFVNDTIDDTGAPAEQTDPGWAGHRSSVGAVLSSIDADVVIVQEVEHEAALEELNALELGGGYTARVIDGNDPRGIEVGVLSKMPIDQIVSHQDDVFAVSGTQSPTYSYSRDALEVHITYNGRPIVLIGVHYRSKSNDDPARRLAEAQHTRGIADAITNGAPGTGVIILGDFNDVPDSPPYVWTIGEPPGQYTNAAALVSQADRWTYDFNGNLELVDQQMASPLMADKLDAASVRILHGPEVEAASDHAPVIATYMVN